MHEDRCLIHSSLHWPRIHIDFSNIMPAIFNNLSWQASYRRAYNSSRTLEVLLHKHYCVVRDSYIQRSGYHCTAFAYPNIEAAFVDLCSAIRNFSSRLQVNSSYWTISLHLQLVKEYFRQYIGIFEDDYECEVLANPTLPDMRGRDHAVAEAEEAAGYKKTQEETKEVILSQFRTFDFHLSRLKMDDDRNIARVAKWKANRKVAKEKFESIVNPKSGSIKAQRSREISRRRRKRVEHEAASDSSSEEQEAALDSSAEERRNDSSWFV